MTLRHQARISAVHGLTWLISGSGCCSVRGMASRRTSCARQRIAERANSRITGNTEKDNECACPLLRLPISQLCSSHLASCKTNAVRRNRDRFESWRPLRFASSLTTTRLSCSLKRYSRFSASLSFSNSMLFDAHLAMMNRQSSHLKPAAYNSTCLSNMIRCGHTTIYGISCMSRASRVCVCCIGLAASNI